MNEKAKRIFIIALAGIFLTACAEQQAGITVSQYAQGTPAFEETQFFLFSGIGQTRHINAASICGGMRKVQRVESQRTGLDVIISVLTVGIITPWTARVYCAGR